MAATINVGETCTLVRAINAANNDTTASGNCRKGSGADTIVLPRGSTQRLTSVNNDDNGLPVIRSDITIAGNNSTIRRAASAPDFRIFAVGDTGDLMLRRATVSGGVAPLPSSGGSQLSVEGGAVYNVGTFTLINSTISGNRAFRGGGGVKNGGIVSLVNSTISDNSASFGGGVTNGAYYNGDFVGF